MLAQRTMPDGQARDVGAVRAQLGVGATGGQLHGLTHHLELDLTGIRHPLRGVQDLQ